MSMSIKTHHDVEKKKLLDNRIIFLFILLLLFVSTLVAYMYIRNGLDSLIASNLTIKSDNDQLQQKVIYLESEIIDLTRPGQIQSQRTHRRRRAGPAGRTHLALAKNRRQEPLSGRRCPRG